MITIISLVFTHHHTVTISFSCDENFSNLLSQQKLSNIPYSINNYSYHAVHYKTFLLLFPPSELLLSKFCLLFPTQFGCPQRSRALRGLTLPAPALPVSLFCLYGTDSILPAGVLIIQTQPDSTVSAGNRIYRYTSL